MDAHVSVDGFNLYYSALRGKTGTRWLDVGALVSSILPSATINKIKYFTAKVSARAWDLNQPVRQQTYLRALQTLSNVEIYFGHFLTHPVWRTLVVPNPSLQLHANNNPIWAQVVNTEEKGSDVNLATHLLVDLRKPLDPHS